jgi:hypothetical protein
MAMVVPNSLQRLRNPSSLIEEDRKFIYEQLTRNINVGSVILQVILNTYVNANRPDLVRFYSSILPVPFMQPMQIVDLLGTLIRGEVSESIESSLREFTVLVEKIYNEQEAATIKLPVTSCCELYNMLQFKVLNKSHVERFTEQLMGAVIVDRSISLLAIDLIGLVESKTSWKIMSHELFSKLTDPTISFTDVEESKMATLIMNNPLEYEHSKAEFFRSLSRLCQT